MAERTIPARLWKEREAANDWEQKDLLGTALWLAEQKDLAEELRNAKVLISGASGLIGSQFAKTLLCVSRILDIPMEVHVIARSRERAASALGSFAFPRTVLHLGDIRDAAFVAGLGEYTHVVHAAAVTNSKMMVERPVDTIDTMVRGTQNLLELACRPEKKARFLYISSMEVYGDMSGQKDTRAPENTLGFIDPSKVRSDYPESKRLCENLCAAYGVQYGVDVRVARLAQTFGPGILPWEGRVFAQFAKSALEGRDIVLHTRGTSEGNYVYTQDCMKALLLLLLAGEKGLVCNVADMESHTTIRGMAEMVAEKFGRGRTRLVFDIPEENIYGYAGETKLFVDSTRLMGLGWEPETHLEKAYGRLLHFLEEERSWEDGNVRIRPIRRSDTDEIIRWRDEPEVREHFVYREPFTWESHLAWLENHVDAGDAMQFIIELSGEPVGSVYLRDIDREKKSAESGLFIDRDACGKGVGTKAYALLHAYARDELGLERLLCRIFSDNDASIRLHRRAGYVPCGSLPGVVCSDGSTGDMILMEKRLSGPAGELQ